MYPDSSEGLNRETEEAIYFFTPAFDPFNNFSAHTVRIWDKVFPTVEHAFQWKKFEHTLPEMAARILEAESPEKAKIIARQHRKDRSPAWDQDKVGIMEAIIRAKAEQHADVREALRRSGGRTIVENSPVDGFWGAGPDGRGENWVGKILMKIRDEHLPTH